MMQCLRMRSAIVRRLAFALSLLWVGGCLSLPSVPSPAETPREAPQVQGARGPLSRQESAAILQKLKAKSGADGILERHVALEEAVAGNPLVGGNKVALLQDGPATYQAMFKAMRAARDHINLETYIFEDDEIGRRFAEMLIEQQARGVQVNVIYDSFGSIKTPRAFFDHLREAGIRVLEFGPVNPLEIRKEYALTHRDHQKLMVVDGRVAFIGGINISAVYSSSSFGRRSASGPSREPKGAKDLPWRDTEVRIEGPVVRDFQKLFLDTWNRQNPKQPLPQRNYFPELKSAGPDLVRAIGSDADEAYSPMYVTLVSAINNAETNIGITAAYFLPDPQLMDALTAAARRGVPVTLVLPSQSDFGLVFNAGRSRYEALLEAGVKIYERREALLHAKTMFVDGVWSTIGSTNIDPLSFLHNDEANAVVLGFDFAGQMQAMFERDIAQSKRVTLQEWRHRPIRDRVMEWAGRLWEYWM